ncbi:hypothetical protein [Nostoc sp.]|uniref:hypothetical protein n=1 Tax=Nostoc sp. TaxID=1180 RepID=UPI002FF92DB8
MGYFFNWKSLRGNSTANDDRLTFKTVSTRSAIARTFSHSTIVAIANAFYKISDRTHVNSLYKSSDRTLRIS